MSYIELREKSRYLKEISKGAGKELRDDEILACEDFADVYIEGKLGKSWDAVYPQIIVRIADMLASAMAWQYLHSGQTPQQSEYSDVLRKQADDLLNQILDGELGIKLDDGSWDEDYPGNANKEDSEGGFEIII